MNAVNAVNAVNAMMGTNALMDCTLRNSCRARPRQRVPLAARLLALALACAGGLLAASGEHWLLQEAPAVNEMTLATCTLDSVYGVEPAGACTLSSKADDDHEQGHSL